MEALFTMKGLKKQECHGLMIVHMTLEAVIPSEDEYDPSAHPMHVLPPDMAVIITTRHHSSKPNYNN